MKKIIDFDGIFEEKLSLYMKQNAGKYTEAQWESLIPKLYKKFSETPLKKAGCAPRDYYADQTDAELIQALKAHIQGGVPVSDFLCREIEKRDCPRELLPFLTGEDEELALAALPLTLGSPKAIPAYFALLKGDFSDARKEAAREWIRENADRCKELALSGYESGTEPDFMLEILSLCKERDDRVLSALLRAFKTAEDPCMAAGFLASYGDERALPVLKEALMREDLGYLEFREIRFAVEALGGEPPKERDFSEDPVYLELAQKSADLDADNLPQDGKT